MLFGIILYSYTYPTAFFVILLAYLRFKLRKPNRIPMATRISDKVHRLCTAQESVTLEYAKDPSYEPGHYADKLYGGESILADHQLAKKKEPLTGEDLERARQCGSWGDSKPSKLFLQCFHDAVCALEGDPLAGMVSPSLMGSTGMIPLTIIAPLPDICRHMANLIARAEHEVFLASNYWISSDASRLITDSLVELSRRAESRGKKVIVKIMYDRGNLKQVVDNHLIVPVKEYTSPAVKLPHPADVPGLDIQVQNYHRPMLGTFHTKMMVVDRKAAVVQSNNIQDNDNLEMMTHLEGPIVDSLYDTALLAWHTNMSPTLPLLGYPASALNESTFSEPTFLSLFNENNPNLVEKDGEVRLDEPGDSRYDPDIASEFQRMQRSLEPQQGESPIEPITRHLNRATKLSQKAQVPEDLIQEPMMPLFPHKAHTPFPMALVNRKPWGTPNHQCVNVPQNEAWLSAIRNATSSIFIQTPNLNAAPLMPALKEALTRGVEVTYYVCLGYNDGGELLPFQGGTNEMFASRLYESLDDTLKPLLNVHYYVAKDQVEPIHNSFKIRSCHIKLMIVDGHLGIQGNGNQDTQSWYHSMEVNIMIDSVQICREWRDLIERNQSKFLTLKSISQR